MKKIFDKKTIFSFILGVLLCSGIVYGVNKYESNSIEYSPTDSSWAVSNVNEAINSLYSMKNELDNLKGIGDAVAGNILSGKKAVVKGNIVTGTMANRGTLNWNPSAATTYKIQPGYYAGGTLNSTNAYTTGYNNGKSIFKITNLYLYSLGNVNSHSESHGARGEYEMTFDVSNNSKVTFGTITLVAGQSDQTSTLVVTLDGQEINCTSGTVLDVSGKSTLKIFLKAVAHGWLNNGGGESSVSASGSCTISYLEFS